jgi:subtilisin family serine protease
VAFTDKGIESADERTAALLELERTFDRRALERRRRKRTSPGLFDEHDLALHPPYVEAVASTGARVRVRSRWLNGITVLATQSQLGLIERLPFVEAVSDLHLHIPKGERRARIPNDPDLRHTPGPGTDPHYGWSAPQIRQLNLHHLHEAGFRGAGIRIGVVDTGFLLSHAAFQDPGHSIQVVAQWDFMDNDSVVTPEPGDSPVQHLHGTLVLGTLASNKLGEMVGSAPEAEYILLKAEDDATEYLLEERWFAAALEFAEAHGADIITSSVILYRGYEPDQVDGRSSVMARAWNLAVANGIVGLQGGGNAGHDQDPTTHHFLPPAAAAGVITVGAVDSTGEIAPFSSDGLRVAGTVKPELLAWGTGTASISPFEPDAYTTTAGTSVATPLLAGAVACLLQKRPRLTVRQARDVLFRSGDYFRSRGRPDPLLIRGYGIPDLARAAGLEPPESRQLRVGAEGLRPVPSVRHGRLAAPLNPAGQGELGSGAAGRNQAQLGWGASGRNQAQLGWGASGRNRAQLGWGASGRNQAQLGSGAAGRNQAQPGPNLPDTRHRLSNASGLETR